MADSLRRQRLLKTSSAWFIDAGPLGAVLVAAWAKLLYFSISQRRLWSDPEASLGEWAFAHPHVFSANFGCLLLLLSVCLLLPRRTRALAIAAFYFALTSLVVMNLIHVGYYGDVISFWSVANLSTARSVAPIFLFLIRPVHVL